MNGIFNVDKPIGPSSFQVIARLRRITGEQKMGHVGTLDPLASGVLPICVGKAVRLSEYLQTDHKVYEAEITLGIRTNTDDGEGEIISQREVALSRDEVAQALAGFVGEQEQVPPQFAAIKIEGRPMYKLARRGQAVVVAPRRITIERLDLLDWQPPRVRVLVACSKGTYIRALARDVGERLGCGAFLSALRRTQCGAFSVSDAVALDRLETDWRSHLLPMDFGLRHWDAVYLDEGAARRILNGLSIAADGPHTPLVRAYDGHSSFIAILSFDAVQHVLKPDKVFAGPPEAQAHDSRE